MTTWLGGILKNDLLRLTKIVTAFNYDKLQKIDANKYKSILPAALQQPKSPSPCQVHKNQSVQT